MKKQILSWSLGLACASTASYLAGCEADSSPSAAVPDGGGASTSDASADDAAASHDTGAIDAGASDAQVDADPCAFGAPSLVTELNTDANDRRPWVTSDGLEVYFDSDRDGGAGGNDIWHASRPSTNVPFSTPVPVTALNTADHDSVPTLSADGLSLYFDSNRPGGTGLYDIYVAKRATTADPFGAPVELAEVSSNVLDASPTPSADELALYFTSDRPAAVAGRNIWVATRASKTDPFGTPVLATSINSDLDERTFTISPDGLGLFVSTNRTSLFHFDIWQFTRKKLTDPFVGGAPVVELNSTSEDYPRSLSADGLTIYFSSERVIAGAAKSNIFVATRKCH